MKSATASILFLYLILFITCNTSTSHSSMSSKSKCKESFIETKEVKLQYLDWGGQGQALVLICGLGDTPFLFDSLAKQLSANFPVISYSRRDHARSKAAEEKYDNATLVSDLKLLLDSLGIAKANLLGWSMGGNEITGFASLYPDRISKLIYFESGYDLSDGGFEKLVRSMPRSYLPDSSVMQSLDNYREWYHHFWFGDMEWNNALEANLLASVQVQNDGSIETIPNNRIFKSILAEAMKYRRRYESIQVPALVIYAKPFFHPADNNPATVELYDNIETSIVSPWRLMNKKQIEQALKNAVVVDAPRGTHTSFLFLSHDFLVKTINDFLLAHPPK